MKKVLSRRRSFPPSTAGAAGTTTTTMKSRGNSQSTRITRPPPPIITAGSNNRSSSPTSHFSDIEELESSSPYLALTNPTTPHDLGPSITSATAETKIEPFVSPLTEANLMYHTNSYQPSNNKEVRHQFITTYVEAQASVLRLEVELQRQRRAEIRSLVPLDTRSIDEEVIQDAPIIDEGTTATAAAAADTPTTNTPMSKKKRRKWPLFWFFQRTEKKTDAAPSTNQQTPPSSSHHQPAATASIASVRPFSWAGGRTSHYHQETLDMVFQGMVHGLNNQNIARALGCEQVAMNLFSRPSATTNQGGSSSSGTGTGNMRRDSGISVVTSKKRHHSSMRFAPRLGRLREAIDERDKDEDDDNASKQQTPPSPTDRLIGYRYPRMVQRQTLREAAIQVLSSDISFYGSSSTVENIDDNDDFVFNTNNKRFSDPGTTMFSQLQRQPS